jgi:tetratricopeptide (TPR) repeat protein
LEHYEAALGGIETGSDPDPALLIDVTLAWAFARSKADDFGGVLERLERAEAAARRIGDKSRLARALTWIGNVHVLTGFPSRAVPPLIESQGLANELGQEDLTLLPFFFATETLVDRDPRAAVGQLEQLIDLSREHGSLDIEGHAHALLAVAHARLGAFDPAEKAIERALEMTPRVGSVIKQADIHIGVGMAYTDMGEHDKGIEHARRGAELAYSVGGIECACAGNLSVGMGELGRNRLDDALAAFDRSLRLADDAGWLGERDPVTETWVNRIRAGVAAAEFEGGAREAVQNLAAALTNARSDRDDYVVAVISERLARAHLRLDELAEAEAHVDAAIQHFRRTEMRPYLARALDVAAAIQDRRGQTESAERFRTESEELRAGFRA